MSDIWNSSLCWNDTLREVSVRAFPLKSALRDKCSHLESPSKRRLLRYRLDHESSRSLGCAVWLKSTWESLKMSQLTGKSNHILVVEPEGLDAPGSWSSTGGNFLNFAFIKSDQREFFFCYFFCAFLENELVIRLTNRGNNNNNKD